MHELPPTIDNNGQNPENNHSDFMLKVEGLYKGVMAGLARTKMERAANTMERMDHKDALYHDIGKAALGETYQPHVTAQKGNYNPNDGHYDFIPARARTSIERHIDKSLDKKAYKKSVADTYKFIHARTFGANATETLSTRKDILMGRTKEVDGLTKQATISRRLTERRYGPQINGTGKKEKEEAIAEINKSFKRGEVSAHDARIQKLQAKTAKPKYGEESYKNVIRESRNTNAKLRGKIRHIHSDLSDNHEHWPAKNIIQSPIAYWRSTKRKRAINRIQTNHNRMLKYGGEEADQKYAHKLASRNN